MLKALLFKTIVKCKKVFFTHVDRLLATYVGMHVQMYLRKPKLNSSNVDNTVTHFQIELVTKAYRVSHRSCPKGWATLFDH